MKTHEVISIKESELVAKLKIMDLADLEKHAQHIMADMGEDNYGAVMGQVMKAIKSDSDLSQFDLVQKTLRDSLPNEAYMSDIYARLAAIVMMILKHKLKAMYQQHWALLTADFS